MKLSDETRRSLGARTRLIHSGRDPSEQFGFINTPIYRGSTVLYPDTESLLNRNARFSYGTAGTPTIRNLEEAWSELSGAAATALAPSGLAAIALALFTAVAAGDHVLICDSAYRPTRNFADGMLKKLGVEVEYYDPVIGAGIERLMRRNTSVVFLEAPGSHSFEMQDVPAIAEIAHRAGACVIMDNTWATPIFFPPHERGVDLAIEAGTKYLSGHSDLLLGLVSANEAWAKRLRETFGLISACAGPEDCFLALRGLRTMRLRVDEAQRVGLEMARWMQARPEVSRVLHPALPDYPGHAIWKRDFLGSTGLFSVILKSHDIKAVAAMLDGMELFGLGFSWGGYESLIIPFDCRAYRTATKWEPEGLGLRLQIGFEDLDDLKADLDRGFARYRAALG
jgi:cystathionine beta-lyase